jgi:hypothetical protein
MTSSDILIHRKAIALEKGLELALELSPLDEPLQLMAQEPIKDDMHVLTEVTASLAKVCSEQRGHIIELAQRLEALEAKKSGDK